MVPVFGVVFAVTTCAPVLSVGRPQPATQNAGASTDRQIYDRFRDWMSGVPDLRRTSQ